MSRCRTCGGPHRASEVPRCIAKQRAYYRRPEVRARERAKARNHYGNHRHRIQQRQKLYRAHLANKEKKQVYDQLRRQDPTIKLRERESNRAYNRDPEKGARIRLQHRVLRRRQGIAPRKQTLPEQRLEGLLHEHFQDDWKYTGQGDVVIGRCAPDFFQVNGKKAIIELYGCYHHGCQTCGRPSANSRPEHDAKRLKMFEDLSFKTLVIWEHELSDPERAINKVREAFYI